VRSSARSSRFCWEVNWHILFQRVWRLTLKMTSVQSDRNRSHDLGMGRYLGDGLNCLSTFICRKVFDQFIWWDLIESLEVLEHFHLLWNAWTVLFDMEWLNCLCCFIWCEMIELLERYHFVWNKETISAVSTSWTVSFDVNWSNNFRWLKRLNSLHNFICCELRKQFQLV
jgi:hypothetical protein